MSTASLRRVAGDVALPALGAALLAGAPGAHAAAQAPPVQRPDADAPCAARSAVVEVADPSAPGGAWRLQVTVPPSGADDGTLGDGAGPLPVVYYLDAWLYADLISGLACVLSGSGDIGPVALVGIGVAGGRADWAAHRMLRFTPSPYDTLAQPFHVQIGDVSTRTHPTGGAPEFRATLDTLLIPAAESRLGVTASRRALVGHSFGGLFGAWDLLRHGTFDDYALLSPAVWWNGRELASASRWPARPDLSLAEHRLYLAVGGEEPPIMTRGVEALAERTREASTAAGDATVRRYEGRDHATMLPAALTDALLFLYGG